MESICRGLRAVVAATVAAMAVQGCVSAHVATTWVATDAPPAPYRSFVVLGVANSERIRDAYEDSYVEALEAIGARATPGHRLKPPPPNNDLAALRGAIVRSGADAVLVTHMLPQEALEPHGLLGRHTPAETDRLFGPYYLRIGTRVNAPDYYSDFSGLRLETNLYDAATERLVWSGHSATVDPGSEEVTIGKLITKTLAQLRADRLLTESHGRDDAQGAPVPRDAQGSGSPPAD